MVGKKKRSKTVLSRKSSITKSKSVKKSSTTKPKSIKNKLNNKLKSVKKSSTTKLKSVKKSSTKSSLKTRSHVKKNLDKNIDNNDLLQGSIFKENSSSEISNSQNLIQSKNEKKISLDDVLGKPPLPSSTDRNLPEIPKPSQNISDTSLKDINIQKNNLSDEINLNNNNNNFNSDSKFSPKKKKSFLSGLFNKKKQEPKLEIPDVDSIKSIPLETDLPKKSQNKRNILPENNNLEARKILDSKKEEFFDSMLKEHQSKKKLNHKLTDKLKVSTEDEKKLKNKLKKEMNILKKDETLLDVESKKSSEKIYFIEKNAEDELKQKQKLNEKKDEKFIKSKLEKDLDVLDKDEFKLDKLDTELKTSISKSGSLKNSNNLNDSKSLIKNKNKLKEENNFSKQDTTNIDAIFKNEKIEKPLAKDFVSTKLKKEEFNSSKIIEKSKFSEKKKKGIFGFLRKNKESHLDVIENSLEKLKDVKIPDLTEKSLTEKNIKKEDFNHDVNISNLKKKPLFENEKIELKTKKTSKIKPAVKKELTKAVEDASFLSIKSTSSKSDIQKSSSLKSTNSGVLNKSEFQSIKSLNNEIDNKDDDAIKQRIARLEKDESVLLNREDELTNLRNDLKQERERFEADRLEFEQKLQSVEASKSKNQNIRMLQLTIEKLKEREAQQIAKLNSINSEINSKSADFDSKTKHLIEWEDRLSVKERELDERENILLTMQTDLIKERRELDDREFSIYMKEELAQLPSKIINKNFEDQQQQIRMEEELSPKNFQIYGRINQTKELLSNGHIHDAKTNYNRIVQDFQNLHASVEEKKKIHLQVLELYNDIHLAEVNLPSEEEQINQSIPH